MDDRPRLQPTDSSVVHLSPTRAELVRFFAWGYFSRRELNERLRESEPRKRGPRHTRVSTAA
jgi:hypothetical protein